jgi:formate transporter
MVRSILLTSALIAGGASAFHVPAPTTRRFSTQRFASVIDDVEPTMQVFPSPNKSGNSPIAIKSRIEPDIAPEGEGFRSERVSLDISKTIYTSSMKSPKDSYLAFAEKGAANAKMSKTKILHQSILGGAYVGFGGLLSLSVAGNLGGIGALNPGAVKMAFAALFPVNLLLIVTTGGQLFTGNSATVAAAKFEGLVEWRQLCKSWAVSLIGNVIGCALFAVAASYVGLLTGGTANLLSTTALNKCRAGLGQTVVKAIMCNWMVSLAVFLAGASNDLVGKLVGVWFPISTFVAIGLEHSVANMFLMPAALLIGVPLTVSDVVFRNVIPVIIGNAIAGALVVAGSYSFQFGKLGKAKRASYREKLRKYEARKKAEKESGVKISISQKIGNFFTDP